MYQVLFLSSSRFVIRAGIFEHVTLASGRHVLVQSKESRFSPNHELLFLVNVLLLADLLQMSIHAAPWTDFDDQHYQSIIMDSIDDAPITNANTVGVIVSGQFATTWRAWIFLQ